MPVGCTVIGVRFTDAEVTFGIDNKYLISHYGEPKKGCVYKGPAYKEIYEKALSSFISEIKPFQEMSVGNYEEFKKCLDVIYTFANKNSIFVQEKGKKLSRPLLAFCSLKAYKVVVEDLLKVKVTSTIFRCFFSKYDKKCDPYVSILTLQNVFENCTFREIAAQMHRFYKEKKSDFPEFYEEFRRERNLKIFNATNDLLPVPPLCHLIISYCDYQPLAEWAAIAKKLPQFWKSIDKSKS